MDDFYFYFVKLTLKQQQKDSTPTAALGYILERILQQTQIPSHNYFVWREWQELQYLFVSLVIKCNLKNMKYCPEVMMIVLQTTAKA